MFLNASYYNEEGSQISKDAATLKVSSPQLFIAQTPSRPCPLRREGYLGKRMETAVSSPCTAHLTSCLCRTEGACDVCQGRTRRSHLAYRQAQTILFQVPAKDRHTSTSRES